MVLPSDSSWTPCSGIHRQCSCSLLYKQTEGWSWVPYVHWSLKLWDCYIHHGINLTTVHVPNVLNTHADFLSWTKANNQEWSLNLHYLRSVFSHFSHPKIDVFATPENAKCPILYTRESVGRASQEMPFCTGGLGLYITSSHYFLGF